MRLSFNGEYAISNPFGVYDPSAYARYPGMRHPGTDFALPANTPLVAGMTGEVSMVRSTARIGRGNEVIITNKNRQRKTCHMNRIDVADGQWVKEGDPIGLSGYTGYVVDSKGRVGTEGGAHLHDELLINDKYVNLMEHLKEDDMIDTQDKVDDLLTLGYHFTSQDLTEEARKSIFDQDYPTVVRNMINSSQWRRQNDRLVAYRGLEDAVRNLQDQINKNSNTAKDAAIQEAIEILNKSLTRK